jgi:hypothetical protein
MKSPLLDENLLTEVEKFNERDLQEKSFLTELIKIVNQKDLSDKFIELAFYGKYVNGLFKSLQLAKSNHQISNTNQIQEDLIQNVLKLKELLKEIVSSTEIEKIFNERFSELNPNHFENILNLVKDLNKIKKYLNYIKRNS